MREPGDRVAKRIEITMRRAQTTQLHGMESLRYRAQAGSLCYWPAMREPGDRVAKRTEITMRRAHTAQLHGLEGYAAAHRLEAHATGRRCANPVIE